ncbi:MAG: Uma2 family endonuclease [Candidatus Schekmanbacteria bacterium]|nr:Uma2 family endonuclease [Candidatus Schekmanbacteria bacterium]
MTAATVSPTAETIAPGEHVPTADHRVVLHGMPWSHFEVFLALRGDAAGPRIAYLAGELELMSPSRDHERLKSFIGRLIEAYAMDRGLDLSPYGSWTLKQPSKEAGAEPDECYIIGADQQKDAPDLVIEVAWTRGGLDKLEIYRRLGIRELWLWESNVIQIYLRGPQGYERSASSACFPELDTNLLTSFLDRPTVLQAVRAFRQALAG